jgi:hypothetical protein
MSTSKNRMGRGQTTRAGLRRLVGPIVLVVDIALLADAPMTARAETSGCTQVTDLSTARVRWATVRKNDVNPAYSEQNCRSYATNFFEAVTAREAVSFCKDSLDRERILQSLDHEIEAFNHLIATTCSP